MTTKITNFFDFDGKFFSLATILTYLSSTDHKKIGRLYIFFGSFMAVIATLLSFFIRINLSIPDSVYFGEEYQFYNVIVTAHAVLMILFLWLKNLLVGEFYVKLF